MTIIAYQPKDRCLTRFAFVDIQNLRKNYLQSFFDGNLWLNKRRQKTDTLSNVRLIDAALNIIKGGQG
ncbi:hypothetical protein CGC50_00500 [Capnocytophaga gingivalis]|uniref:Uncharacterized protein n=1 Tax=Capnocytophaga gingivalis TaxID=1017 RepID=A0A250FP75_9FLAO|nr:hypothetical protein CGC50_00500 [Capnocytophaga gingivalis]